MEKKVNAAVAVIANRFESGGERYEALRKAAAEWLDREGFDCVLQSEMVWNSADALLACAELEAQNPDVLVLIHASWVQDSIQHIFTSRLRLPTILFAVPYIETFSLACAQHYAAQLRRYGLPFKVVYGMPGEPGTLEEARPFIIAAGAYKKLQGSIAGVIGPRQTFRVAAAQDMTKEEWDFSSIFGSTIVHIDTPELLSMAESVSEKAAGSIMKELRGSGEISVMIDDTRLAFCARVYLAVQQLRSEYGLSYCTMQCYPANGGIGNLAACLLADEGFVLDTEGDTGHASLLYVYSLFGSGAACLSETGGLVPDYMYLEHEGSSALSLKTHGFRATLRECGDGSMVGFTLREMEKATLASMGEKDGDLVIYTVEGSVPPVDTKAWESLAGRFLGAFADRSRTPKALHTRMVELGVDHHFALKEGLHANGFHELCGMLGIDHIAI